MKPLIFIFSLILISETIQTEKIEFYGMQHGAEATHIFFKLTVNPRTFQLSDTLYMLDPLIDPIKDNEINQVEEKINIPSLFRKYKAHPILLRKKETRDTLVRFQTDTFTYYDSDTIQFEFSGVYRKNIIVGRMKHNRFVKTLSEHFIDTLTVTFKTHYFEHK